jgi:cleavage stimulation factor subunit 2
MAHRQRGPRNDVFVGNIAFGTTDEDIRRIFSEVGRVKNVRMAVNSETGKPRGFCFVEYDDAATALSAIRNLNGRDVGGRDLRVNFSNNSALVDYASRGGSGREKAGSQLSATDITARLSDREVWDVVSEAKRLAEGDAETLGRLLNASGALTSAFVDMLGTLGMVPSAKGPSAAFAPQKPVSGFSAPQPDAMMQQVMQLTPAQLAQLPPDRRAKIEALRARIAQGLVPGAPPQPTAADINML